MKIKHLPCIAFLVGGCALTAPEGTRELMDDIQNDRQRVATANYKEMVGAPVFLKVRAYPRIQNGNIYGKYWLYMQVRRQKLNLDKLVKSLD